MIIFDVDTGSSVHIDYNKKDILIVAKGPTATDGLDETTVTAHETYFIDFTEQLKQLCSTLYYHELIVIHLLRALKYTNSEQKMLKSMQFHYD